MEHKIKDGLVLLEEAASLYGSAGAFSSSGVVFVQCGREFEDRAPALAQLRLDASSKISELRSSCLSSLSLASSNHRSYQLHEMLPVLEEVRTAAARLEGLEEGKEVQDREQQLLVLYEGAMDREKLERLLLDKAQLALAKSNAVDARTAWRKVMKLVEEDIALLDLQVAHPLAAELQDLEALIMRTAEEQRVRGEELLEEAQQLLRGGDPVTARATLTEAMEYMGRAGHDDGGASERLRVEIRTVTMAVLQGEKLLAAAQELFNRNRIKESREKLQAAVRSFEEAGVHREESPSNKLAEVEKLEQGISIVTERLQEQASSRLQQGFFLLLERRLLEAQQALDHARASLSIFSSCQSLPQLDMLQTEIEEEFRQVEQRVQADVSSCYSLATEGKAQRALEVLRETRILLPALAWRRNVQAKLQQSVGECETNMLDGEQRMRTMTMMIRQAQQEIERKRSMRESIGRIVSIFKETFPSFACGDLPSSPDPISFPCSMPDDKVGIMEERKEREVGQEEGEKKRNIRQGEERE
eukprot:75344-Hanusia_phi.AAC.1